MITGLHDIETAVKAMKFGALDYLPKPFEPEDLQMLVREAFDRRARLRGELRIGRQDRRPAITSKTSSAPVRRCKECIVWSHTARPPTVR